MFAKLTLTQKGLCAISLPLVAQLLVIGLLVMNLHQSAAGRWTLVTCAILSLLAILAAPLPLHYAICRKLVLLKDNAHRLAQGQALAPPIRGDDEIGQLDRAFHAMAESIANAEQRLRESLAEARDLYNQAPCGYHSLGADGTFVAVNDTELEWLGYERQDVLGKLKFADVMAPESRAVFPRLQTQGALNTVKLELCRKNGERFPILWNSTTVRDAAGTVVATRATLIDITSLEKAEATIRQYADIVKNIPIGLIIYDLDDTPNAPALRLASANPMACQLLGIELDEMCGKTITEVLPNIDKAHVDTYIDIARKGRVGHVNYVDYGDTRVSRSWWSVQAFALPHRSMVVAFENITERKRATEEVRRLNEELEQRVLERTAELGETNRELVQKNQENELFVYSVSHDLRSPLVNLEGFSQELGSISHELRGVLQDEQVPASARARGLALLDGDMKEALRFIQNAVRRLSNIIDALLRLSRAGRVEYAHQHVNLTKIVRRIVDAMRNTIESRGAVVEHAEVPPLWGDPTALEQVFANLLGNALNYLDPARPGRIEIGWKPSDAGNNVYYVKDNGLGIPAAYHEKIFQAFQRVHPGAAPGEGMGLAIARRIVERHRGRIWVESQVGKGSTFCVMLPFQSWSTEAS